ncbi:hypothetical protein [Micromonospora chalcea]|uniref:hypothetical protein n=1 Tax=Micromonospora chalcea TaxID=1874 RepID=UPI0033E26D6F
MDQAHHDPSRLYSARRNRRAVINEGRWDARGYLLGEQPSYARGAEAAHDKANAAKTAAAGYPGARCWIRLGDYRRHFGVNAEGSQRLSTAGHCSMASTIAVLPSYAIRRRPLLRLSLPPSCLTVPNRFGLYFGAASIT